MAHVPRRGSAVRRSTAGRLLCAAALAVAPLAGVTGCGTDTGEPPPELRRSTAADPTRSASRDPAPEHSGSAQVSASSRPTVTTQVSPRPVGLRRLLLTADQVPGLEAGWQWRATRTDKESEQAFGACQRTPMTTIGAEAVLVRSYADAAGSSGSSAAQLVARFADPRSAWRAHEVVKAWRTRCTEWLRFPDEDVSALGTVKVASGVGQSYLAAYGPGGGSADRHVDGLGIYRHGRYLALLQVNTVGQADYPFGQRPATRAVRRVARLF